MGRQLMDCGIEVAAHGNELRRHGVQALGNLGGRIACRQRISRTVVKDIA